MKPNLNEFLIVVLGGTGEGESIVVHLGDDRWMIIDSCRVGQDTLALKYFVDNKIPYANVDYIVCTHWHADHVYGLGEILTKCENAQFLVPIVSQSKMMPYYFMKKIAEKDIHDFETVAQEFKYCMDLAKKRKKLGYLVKDKNIFKGKKYNHVLSIDSLSPSDSMLTKYHKLWASRKNEHFDESGVDPNKSSVAIGVSIDDKLHFLFGADLECNRPDDDDDFANCVHKCQRRRDVGWCNVCCESTIYNYHGKYDYVKIIHHSSKTGFCPRMWYNKVSDNVIGVSTVFSKDGLPTPDMGIIYLSRCKDYYVAAPPPSYYLPERVANIDSVTDIERMEQTGIVSDIMVVPRTYGSVVSKYNIENCTYEGTELEGTAFKYA